MFNSGTGVQILDAPIGGIVSDYAQLPEMSTGDRASSAVNVGVILASCVPVPTRLLIVEDSAATTFAIRAFFASVGYDVQTAPDATTATTLLEHDEYDVVITDLNLGPGGTNEGVDVIARARQRSAHTCIILLTAFRSGAVETDARGRGADIVCAKPIALRDLSELIDVVLRRRRLPPPRGC
jgi:two-component system, OmpR family, response regulator TctD